VALEAQEVAVRVRLLGGTAYQRDANATADATERIGKAGAAANAESDASVATQAGLVGLLSKSGKTLSTHGQKVQKLGRDMKEAGRSAMTLSAGIGFIGYESVKAATEYGKYAKLLETNALTTPKQLKELEDGTHGWATALGTTPIELIKALYPIQSSLKNTKEDLWALKAAALGAKVGLDTLPNTANAVAGALKTHLKDIHNPNEAIGLMDYFVGSGKLHLPEFTQALTSGVLQQGSQDHLGFRDIGAVLSAMAKSTIPPMQEATRMRLVLTKMAAVDSPAALRALRSIGLEQYSLAHDMEKPEGLNVALRDLREHLKKLPQDVQNVKLAEMFGQSRGFATIAGLLQNLKEIEKIRKGSASITGEFTEKKFKQATETLAFKWEALKGTIDEALIGAGEDLGPTVLPIITEFAHITAGLLYIFTELPAPLRDVFVGLAGIGLVAGPVLWIFGNLFTVIGGGMRLLGFLSTYLSKMVAADEAMAATQGISIFAEGLKGIMTIGLGAGALYALWYIWTHKPPGWFYDAMGLKSTVSNKAEFAKQHAINAREHEVHSGVLHPHMVHLGPHGEWTEEGAISGPKGPSAPELAELKKSLSEVLHLKVPVFIDGRKVAEAVHQSDREQVNRR
jgi:Phage-related minor tail protein